MELIKKESLLKLDKEEIIEYKDKLILKVLDSRYKWMACAVVSTTLLGLLIIKLIVTAFIL